MSSDDICRMLSDMPLSRAIQYFVFIFLGFVFTYAD